MRKFIPGNFAKVKHSGEIGMITIVDDLLHQLELKFKEEDYYVFGFDQVELMEDTEMFETKLNGAELHKQILDNMHDVYKRKNQDYGNSFSEQYEEYGLLSALIRLDDKMRRLKQLSKHEAKIKDESIEDTLLDLANYSIMTIMELCKLNK